MYDFLHISDFFDKHYHSCKTLTKQSILIFVLDTFALLVADISAKTISIYDCDEERLLSYHDKAIEICKFFI